MVGIVIVEKPERAGKRDRVEGVGADGDHHIGDDLADAFGQPEMAVDFCNSTTPASEVSLLPLKLTLMGLVFTPEFDLVTIDFGFWGICVDFSEFLGFNFQVFHDTLCLIVLCLKWWFDCAYKTTF